MRVLVTGGSGFIGSTVLDVLLESGDDVSNYDVKPPLFQRHRDYWFEGDVLDARRLARCFAEFQPDAVIHLAAKADIFAKEWSEFASIHQGTKNLLDTVEGYGKLDRLVNVSTQMVIGPEYNPRSVLDYRPYTPYGEAKAYAEALLLQWRTKVHWFIVRPTNIWGPHHPSFADTIWKHIRNRVYLQPEGRRPVMRAYGFIRNSAEQIVSLMRCDPSLTGRQIFYVADSVMDSAVWIDAFAHALTRKRARRVSPGTLRAIGLCGDLAARLGFHPPIDSGRTMRMTHSYIVPLAETHTLTGAPRIDLETGVAETLAWLNGSSGERCVKSPPETVERTA